MGGRRFHSIRMSRSQRFLVRLGLCPTCGAGLTRGLDEDWMDSWARVLDEYGPADEVVRHRLLAGLRDFVARHSRHCADCTCWYLAEWRFHDTAF